MSVEWFGIDGLTFLTTVAHLLQHHASKIILLSNKEEHASEAIEELKDWGNTDVVQWQQCDLADLKQTNEVAHELKSQLEQLDALICNAGLGVGKYWETKDALGKPSGPHRRRRRSLPQRLPFSNQSLVANAAHDGPSSKFAGYTKLSACVSVVRISSRCSLIHQICLESGN